jgi:hypothetical protein
MLDADNAVLDTVENALLNPAVIASALAHAEAAIATDRSADQRAALEEDLAGTEAAIRRLTTAIATGGDLTSLVDALKTYEERRSDLEARLAAIRAPRPSLDPAVVRQQLEGYLVDWRGLLRANVQQGQQILRRLIKGRLTFTPCGDHYEFSGTGTIKPLIGGVIQMSDTRWGMFPQSVQSTGRKQTIV